MIEYSIKLREFEAPRGEMRSRAVVNASRQTPLYNPEADGFYQDPYSHYARARAVLGVKGPQWVDKCIVRRLLSLPVRF